MFFHFFNEFVVAKAVLQLANEQTPRTAGKNQFFWFCFLFLLLYICIIVLVCCMCIVFPLVSSIVLFFVPNFFVPNYTCIIFVLCLQLY